MLTKDARVVILGAAGFLGRETVRHAAEQFRTVVAVTRRDLPGSAEVVIADAGTTGEWISKARGAAAIIDLVQPALPKRVTRNTMREIAAYRADLARKIAAALAGVPENERPVYISVSGLDGLLADEAGVISDRSPMEDKPRGFGRIGAAVANAIADSPITTTYVHLGSVYGPGKGFVDRMLPNIKAGRFPILGRGQNRVSLIHVSDAARALVTIAALGKPAASTRWIVTDGATLTQREFVETIASAIRAPKPRRVPRWLGAIVAGGTLVHELTKDAPSDPSALTAAGWKPAYPTFAEGLRATLASLQEIGGSK